MSKQFEVSVALTKGEIKVPGHDDKQELINRMRTESSWLIIAADELEKNGVIESWWAIDYPIPEQFTTRGATDNAYKENSN